MKISFLKLPLQLFFFLTFFLSIPNSIWAGCGGGYKNSTLNVSFNKCNSNLIINDLKIYEYNLGKDDYADFVKVYLYRKDAWELIWLIQKDSVFEGATLQKREDRSLYYGNINSGNFSATIKGREVDSWWVFADLAMQGFPQDIINTGKIKIKVEAQMHNSCKDTAHALYENTWVFDLQEITAPDNFTVSKNNCKDLEFSWQKAKQAWEHDTSCQVTGTYNFEIFDEENHIATLPASTNAWVDKSFYDSKEYNYSVRTSYQFFDQSARLYSARSNSIKNEIKRIETPIAHQPKNIHKDAVSNSIVDSLLKANKALNIVLEKNKASKSTQQQVVNNVSVNNDLDSVLNINRELNALLASKDSLISILTLKSVAASEIPNQSDSLNTIPGDYIVVGVYTSMKQAIYNQEKHGYKDFEIVKSKSGKWYYIAAPLKESDQVFSALRNIRNSITKNAWWLKLE